MLRKYAQRHHGSHGFTLIELMVVVAIVSFLGAMAIPNFIKFQCRSKQSEAKANLKALFAAEETYRVEFDVYVNMDPITVNTDIATVQNPIGFVPKGTTIRYDYVANALDNGTKLLGVAEANTVEDVLLRGQDRWEIDDEAHMRNIGTACE